MTFFYACRNSLLVFLLLEEPLNHARSNIYLSRNFLETFFKRFEAEMNIFKTVIFIDFVKECICKVLKTLLFAESLIAAQWYYKSVS